MVFDTYHLSAGEFFSDIVVHRFMRVFFEHRKYKRIFGNISLFLLLYNDNFSISSDRYSVNYFDYEFNYYVHYFFNLRSKSSKENYLCCLHVSFYGSSGNNCGSYDWIY